MDVEEADGVGAGLVVDGDADDGVAGEEEGDVLVFVFEDDFGDGEGFDEGRGDSADAVLGFAGGDEFVVGDGEIGEVEAVGVGVFAVADGALVDGVVDGIENEEGGADGECGGDEEDPSAGGEGEEVLVWVLGGVCGGHGDFAAQ